MILEVTRETKLRTEYFCVGDRIKVSLAGFGLLTEADKMNGFGEFTATAQRVTDEGTLFLFDNVIATYHMNKYATSDGGFEESDMKQWLVCEVLKAFPQEMRDKISSITIPTYGEIFGHNEFSKHFEPDNDEQFESMKQRINRVCEFDDNLFGWWLRNAVNPEYASTNTAIVNGIDSNSFGAVNSFGDATYCRDASVAYGVRPEFWLINEYNLQKLQAFDS